MVLSTRAVLPVGVAALIVASLAGPAPAAGATFISGTGKWGVWGVSDTSGQRGARCIYEAGGINLLDRIRVRPPQMNGFYASNTWVGWKFKIFRRVSGSWLTAFISGTQKDLASESTAANSFTWRTWTASENPNGHYKVRVVMFWYVPGSSTTVEGKVVVEYDWYLRKIDGSNSTLVANHYCNYYQELS